MGLCAPTALTSKLETCNHHISKNKSTGRLASESFTSTEAARRRNVCWDPGEGVCHRTRAEATHTLHQTSVSLGPSTTYQKHQEEIPSSTGAKAQVAAASDKTYIYQHSPP
eukprot:g33203.t1